MSLTSSITDETQVVTVNADRIDAALAIRFKDDMRTETEDGPSRVILDLSAVDFVDSSGLGAIVAAMKQLGSGRSLDLAGLSPTVEKVFRLTRMDSVFDLYPSLDDALAGIAD
ncbi:MAG: STAS domain-containing protein [Pseudomonadota bacterium]